MGCRSEVFVLFSPFYPFALNKFPAPQSIDYLTGQEFNVVVNFQDVLAKPATEPKEQ